MKLSLNHPTDRPNFTEVNLGGLSIYFSYRTPIGFYGSQGREVRQNDWGVTTGRHLNYLDGGNKKARLPGDEFQRRLDAELAALGAQLIEVTA